MVTRYGGPEALRVVEEECPEPKQGEVRVRVLAAGVSLPDINAREGVHPETPPVPFSVDVVFDPIGGAHLRHSRRALRPGGSVVGYSTSLRGEELTSSRPGRRQRFRGTAVFGLYVAGGFSRAGDGWSPTASSGSSGAARPGSDRTWAPCSTSSTRRRSGR